MRPPLLRWLSFRVRVLCIVVFCIGAFLPPYAPRTAQAFGDDQGSQQFLFVEEGFLMKSSSLGVQGSRLAFNQGTIYRVKDGDSLETIAKQFSITPQTIRWTNDISEHDNLQPGQDLVILPVDGVLHAVKSGQTLGQIAKLYSVSADAIASQNRIRNSLIVAGQELIIPGGKPLPGAPPAIAAAGSLQFGGKLSAADLRLKLDLGEGVTTQRGAGAGPAVGAAGAAVTQSMLQWPCEDCTITQYFSPSHYALDIQTKGGGPIFAAADGTVTRADYGWDGGYGNVIEIDHGNGMVTLYGHNKELYVKAGDHVKRGEKISWMGHTGLVHGPTGIHVHFEVRVNGVKKNPLLYLE